MKKSEAIDQVYLYLNENARGIKMDTREFPFKT